MELLTSMNCHRVVKVREIASPEKVYDFACYARTESGRGLSSEQFHRLQSGEDVVWLNTHATSLFKNYEVVEFNSKRHLGDLYKKAIIAHEWSSMDPERAARVEMVGYEEMLNSDLDSIPEQWHDEYYNKFHDFVSGILDRESRIASAFVTGPAKFNTRRNEKANNSYESACKEFDKWRESKMKNIAKSIEAAKPKEVREEERWQSIQKQLDETAASIVDIDTNGGPWNRALFVNSLYGKAETLARNGDKAMLNRYVERVKWWNSQIKKPLLTDRHKFWKLQEFCNSSIEKSEERANRDSVEIIKDGFKVIKNFAEDRLQIAHDEKPDRDTIQRLKENGFRWSPRNGAWQRQLTDNSYYAAARAVDVTVQELREAK